MPDFWIDVRQNPDGSGPAYVIVFASKSDAEVFCRGLIERAEKYCNQDGKRFIKRFADLCLKKLSKDESRWFSYIGLSDFAKLFTAMFSMFDSSEECNAGLLSMIDQYAAICRLNKETLAEKDGTIDIYRMAFAPLGTGADYRGVCS